MHAIPEFICLSCVVLSVILKYLKEPCLVDKVRENLPGMECPVEQACFLPALRLPVPDAGAVDRNQHLFLKMSGIHCFPFEEPFTRRPYKGVYCSSKEKEGEMEEHVFNHKAWNVRNDVF